MEKMTFDVTYEDGRKVESVAKPKDIVAFERQYGVSFGAFADETHPAHMEWLYYLAWSPLHRQRRESAAFDEFLDVVDAIEPRQETEEPQVPLDLAPSPEPLPS